jgi:isocitrate dehydrogenase
VNELDNRASNFYISLYWAEFMAMRNPAYQQLAIDLKNARHDIVNDFKSCQGKSVDLGGYYKFDPIKADQSMRPSKIYNDIIDRYLS